MGAFPIERKMGIVGDPSLVGGERRGAGEDQPVVDNATPWDSSQGRDTFAESRATLAALNKSGGGEQALAAGYQHGVPGPGGLIQFTGEAEPDPAQAGIGVVYVSQRKEQSAAAGSADSPISVQRRRELSEWLRSIPNPSNASNTARRLMAALQHDSPQDPLTPSDLLALGGLIAEKAGAGTARLYFCRELAYRLQNLNGFKEPGGELANALASITAGALSEDLPSAIVNSDKYGHGHHFIEALTSNPQTSEMLRSMLQKLASETYSDVTMQLFVRDVFFHGSAAFLKEAVNELVPAFTVATHMWGSHASQETLQKFAINLKQQISDFDFASYAWDKRLAEAHKLWLSVGGTER